MERRRFIVRAGGALAAAGAASIVDAPNVIAQPKIQWRMSTAFAPSLDMHHMVAQGFAKAVDEMSGGRFRIEVRAGGEIMAPFDCFDAASKGTIEAFFASPQYWNDREPALEWFGTTPFGMNCQGMAARFVRMLERERGRIIPYLFPHLTGRLAGTRIQDFKRAWASTCKKAGVPGRLRHDFRRTAVRNLVNAGVSEKVAMTITGHRTRSVFDRYHIVSPTDLQEAARTHVQPGHSRQALPGAQRPEPVPQS